VRDGVRFGATFHPELAGDPRLHEQFLHAARAA
jgi:glutamine amidotransferase PdxT